MATETKNNRGPVYGLMPAFVVMTPDHIDHVLEIERQCFPTPWTRRAFMFEVTENDFAFYIVAVIDGRVMGYAGMWLVLDEAHITNVAIHPDFRGNGNGRVLMTELLTRAAVLGAVRISLEVRVSNHAARKLYRSLGFADAGIRRKYYSDNDEDAIIMVLNISDHMV